MLKNFRLKDLMVQPGERLPLKNRYTEIDPLYENDAEYEFLLNQLRSELSEMQELLYADNHWSVLLVFQGMDTSGKDSAIKHVMSGINPQGCKVTSFKKPGPNELDHDFLWRTVRALPERGRIGIFNRSYYEEVLVPRVHPEILKFQRIPDQLINGKKIWNERLSDIRNHEAYLSRQGLMIIKFFLHISKNEQRKRLLARIDNPHKNWKFDLSDVDERAHWKAYQAAFNDALGATSTETCPWFVIPADDKMNARLMISQIIVNKMKDLKLHWPRVTPEHVRELKKVRRRLVEGT